MKSLAEQASAYRCSDNGKSVVPFGISADEQKGSHVFYRHPDGRATTVPHHKGRVLARPLIREILREDFISRMRDIDVEKSIPVSDFRKRYG